MQWLNEFEVGHEQLDLEHRVLFDLINRFQHEVEQRAPLESLELILREIRQCVEHHFEWEEHLMIDIGFPDVEKHRLLHKMLIASLKDLVQEISFGSLPPEKLLQYLTNWFTMHTSHDDRELVAYINKRDIQ